ncbi:MAG: GAF domain-containing protein [Anaerolineaceae bacterium]
MLENGAISHPSVWTPLFRLGERLLKQPDTSHQCQAIIAHIQRRFSVLAHIWLASPFYPLPGEPSVPLIDEQTTPSSVLKVQKEKRGLSCTGATTHPLTPDSACQADCWIIPMIEEKNLLGVIMIEFADRKIATKENLSYLESVAAFAALSLQVTRQAYLKNWRYEQLSLVSSVSNQIANEQNLDELCERVVHLIQKTFHYYFVAIFTIDPDSQILNFQASSSSKKEKTRPRLDVRFGEGIVGYVAENGREFLVPNVEIEEQYRYTDYLPETHSEIALPLRVENRILGVLDVQSNKPNAFHDIDLLVLRALADNIAVAIEGARMYNRLQERAEQISAVFEVSRAINSILEIDPLLDQVVELIRKHFNFPYVHLFTVHLGRRKIIYRTGSGARSSAMRDIGFAYDLDSTYGLIPWAVQEKRTILANDVEKEERYRPSPLSPENTHSEMATPLAFAGTVYGVLDIQSDLPNAFDEDDRSIIETLAGSIAIAIRNANLYRAEQWRREVADSFRDVASLISSNIILDQLLDTILTRLEASLPCETSAIWLLSNDQSNPDEQKPMRLASAHGVIDDEIQKVVIEDETVRSWLKRATDSKEPIIRKPDDPYGPLGKALGFEPNYSSIAAPLRAGDETLGVLTLAHHTDGRYGSEAALISSTFASYAAVAIQNARFFGQAQDQAWISTVLLQVASASQTAANPDELLNTITRLTPLLVGVKKCAAFLFDETTRSYILKSWYGFEVPEDALNILEQKSLAFLEMKARMEPIFLQDLELEILLPYRSENANETKILFPLSAHGTIFGALLVIHEPSGQRLAEQTFNDEKFAILQGISHQTATILENLLLIEARNQESYVTEVLLQVAQAVVSQNDLMDILENIIQMMPILVGIDISLVYLWDENTYRYQPAKAAATKVEWVEKMMKKSFSVGENPLLDQVRLKDKPVFYPMPEDDIDLDEWQNYICFELDDEKNEEIQQQNTPFFLGFPLSMKGEFYGILLAKEHQASPSVREKRLEIINGIAQQISLAIQNEHFNRERVNQVRINSEIQFARRIQENFLPETLPEVPDWTLAIRWKTAREVGGDFYDLYQFPDGRVVLVIADVSDKGMPAALYMTVTRTLIRSYAAESKTPAEILQKVNDQLTSERKSAMFVTAVVALLDPQNGTMICSNAGHNPPMILRNKKGKVERIPHGGIALGVTEDCQLINYSTILAPGDSLLMYTDGLTDAISSEGELFGEERLVTLLKQLNKKPAVMLLDEIEKEISNFAKDTPAFDDVTMVAIARNTPDNSLAEE